MPADDRHKNAHSLPVSTVMVMWKFRSSLTPDLYTPVNEFLHKHAAKNVEYKMEFNISLI